MSTCDFDATRLNDYVDGELTRGEQNEVERHLSNCSDCGAELVALRELIAASGRLEGIEPARDLFPGIAAGIETTAATPRQPLVARSAAGSSRWLAAAAAVVLALVGGAAGWLWRGAPEPTQAAAVRSASPMLASDGSDAPALSQIMAATDELADLVEGRRAQISPETAAILERNLAIIDQAIGELREHRQPTEAGEESLALSAMYKQKLELLRRAARLSS